MPAVRVYNGDKGVKTLALFVADLHLSHTPPVARSAEPDWYAAQARPLRQVMELANKLGCVVLCAGDVFDRYGAQPELVNFAVDHLPEMWAVPGQHDLPMHLYADLHKSAYRTLVKTGSILDLGYFDGQPMGMTDERHRVHLFGHPWGTTVEPLGGERLPDDPPTVAVVHSYIWITGKHFAGPPGDAHLSCWIDRLRGYDVAVFGDNHQHFTAKAGTCRVWNCGCLIRRKQDERNLRPTVGLLMEDGSIRAHELDCSEDKWIDEDVGSAASHDGERPRLAEFLGELRGLEAESPDFRGLVRRYAQRPEVPAGVKGLLLKTIGD